MEAKGVIVTIILCLLMLGAGIGGGIFWQAQKTPSTVVAPIDNSGAGQALPQALKDLGSKLVPSISAFGTVSKINGRAITLTKDNDTVVIAIATDAKIYAFTAANPVTKTAPTSKQISFGEVKVGDSVSINLRVLPNGQLEGMSVIVLPPATGK